MTIKQPEREDTVQNDPSRAVIERSEEPQNVLFEAMPDAMFTSLSHAAKLWGKSKNTISDAIARGKIQWVEHQGKKQLLMSQLIQLYGHLNDGTVQNGNTETVLERQENAGRTSDNSGLRAVLEVKEEQISMLKEQIEDLRREREDLKTQRDKWAKAYDEVRALPAPSPTQTPANNQTQPKRSFWPWRRKASA